MIVLPTVVVRFHAFHGNSHLEATLKSLGIFISSRLCGAMRAQKAAEMLEARTKQNPI